MPRNMSFALTTEQFKNRTKIVTRRFAWWFLVPGDVVMGVEKGMGLKKGETVTRLGLIQIFHTRAEPLSTITKEDVALEGFPGRSPEWFVKMMVTHHRCKPDKLINRIQYTYL